LGIPIDNSASAATRAAVEASAGWSEPVVEIARKKSPAPATDHIIDDRQQPSSHGTAALDLFKPSTWNLPKISLPRDSNMPLVTSSDKHAKEALEAYRSLRTRLLKSQASQGFRSILVTSTGKAEGKTLTSFNLACCCAQVENFSVLLIDGDLHSRSLTKLIAGLPATGLADVMSSKASCEDAIVRTDVPNLYVMSAGSGGVSATELFSTEKWGQVIRWSREHFKIVLVDGLSMGASADFELIAPECDGVLMVVRARSTPREALKMAIEQLDASKLVGIVWNGFNS
jgi:capsular exopolysaccharide synthesis family protein